MAEHATPNTEEKDSKPNIEFLDFWASWCGPCQIMKPVIDEIKEEYAGRVEVLELDVDAEKNADIVQEYEIMSVPTYMIRKNGEVVDQFIGVQSKEFVTKKLDAVLKDSE